MMGRAKSLAGPEQVMELMSFAAERDRLLRARTRDGLDRSDSASADLLEGIDEWLERIGTTTLQNTPDLLRIREQQDPNGFGMDEPSRMFLEFEDHWQVFARALNSAPSDRLVNDQFLSLETTVLTTFGFTFATATQIVRALPSFREFRRRRVPPLLGPLGSGLAALTASARQRLTAGSISVASLMAVLRMGRRGVLLSAAIEADGKMVDGLDFVMPSAAATAVCRTSQLLAEVKGYYDASKAW